ncbi:GntR family transcriptional regulator [Rhizobium sp. RU36D]|uniref:GntR family transcriptional regulator n=1 Tax=Rhizobium sp. RU36D TaxID=1907415 RepID=UPI0009D89DEA|nr:GntR family transcriptional regulator [Rhizobium sp. RU36D]SMC51005.1 DNA-binding transcriptional regulator, GntR family [Rhizobium sp. RU36D]
MAQDSMITGSVDALRQPKRISLSEGVADSIAEAIATRIIQPGERVVETTLAEKLGVSRVPIREALKVLHAQGILSGGGHRGYRIATFDPNVTQQVMESRLALESILLRDAIENWRSGLEDVGALQASIDDMRASAKAGNVRASLLADLEFHRTIRLAARNTIAGTLWDTIARHVMIVFNLDRYRDNDLKAIPKQHEEFRQFILAEIAKPASTFADIATALEDHMLLIERTKRRNGKPS